MGLRIDCIYESRRNACICEHVSVRDWFWLLTEFEFHRHREWCAKDEYMHDSRANSDNRCFTFRILRDRKKERKKDRSEKKK